VNLRSWFLWTKVFLVLWLCAAFSAQAQNKVIRLRNEQIATTPPDRTQPFRAAVADVAPVSGLFLIQFTQKFDPTWRAELLARKVELLRYVPDDAFVARLNGVRLEDLRALPFVQWVGEYRPEHKLHGPLREMARARNAASSPEVTVLFSTTAGPVEMAGAKARLQGIRQESRNRFGAVARGKVAPGQLQRLAESPAVLWIEPAPQMKLNDEISTKIVAGEGPGHQAYVHQFGFDGRGVTVAVADSGLHVGTAAGMHPDLAGRTPAFFHYSNGDVEVTDASDEHAHGTHVAGIIAGNAALGTADELGYYYGLGVAPGASIVTQRIFDGLGQYTFTGPFDTFANLTRDAVQAGAVIGNNSWGDDTQGRYDVSAMQFDALVRDADESTPGDQPYILEFSAGNAGPGPQTVGSPAVAKNVIASGASQNDRLEFVLYAEGSEAMADFSSRGPCEDGRIKPDVVAPGTWIASLRSPFGDGMNAWGDIDADYLYMGGTSQAGPQVSGAAAVFVQYYKETQGTETPPSPALVKAALIHSSVDMDDFSGTEPTPNMEEGWGRVDLTEIIAHPTRTQEYLDQAVLLTTGQSYERSVIIASSNEPVKITLVYTDVPGFPATLPALVNDLDLEVIAPDGRIYRGNQFQRGESTPDAPSSDNINNVEGVYIGEPQAGEYLVRVRARNIVEDARRDTSLVADQDFALVVSGDIRSLETGIVLLDRPSYTVPSQMRMKLFDLDLKGSTSATVTVFSATEPAGQKVVLRAPAPNSISFTGAIATATAATAPAAGRLRIAHGNPIRVEYFDASEHVTNAASAVADLIPPVISNVAVSSQFGQILVTWTTDEPASSVVRFNTNSTLSRAVTNNFRTTAHRLELRNLTELQTYYFSVVSADAAGNISTNNNGGTLFSFVVPRVATVLLVDAYIHSIESGDEFIPLTTYTSPLDQIGVSYDVWNTENLGMPVYGDLLPYRVVMWRVNDSFWRGGDIIPGPQQTALQQYLDSGGAFFMSSMEILTRMLDQGGANFVTNVLHVRRYVRKQPGDPERCDTCDEDIEVSTAHGVPNDVIGDGLTLGNLDYLSYPDFFGLFGPNFGDTFGVATNASAFLLEDATGRACAMHYPRTGQDSTGRVVFASFPLDVIPENDPSPNNRAGFLLRALQFLSPGLNGLGSIALSQGAYKLPDLMTIEVGDSDLIGSTGAVVQVSSTTQTAPVTLVLRETVKRGLFRGFLPLVAATNAPAANRLRAAHGDTIFAQYNDASGQGIIQAIATVDTVPAQITGLLAEPDYQTAAIYWDTTEPADALVQFGESAFLGRTAYVSDLETGHEVQLGGLTPDRIYYYKVVSRDAAGNVTEDNNNGQMYTFRTLRPVTPPFIDNLQNGGTNWSVFNGEDSQYGWRVGSPQNGHVANTPSFDGSAWASNLNGDRADYIDSFLISPAIDLTGGNVARLRFANAYDFNDTGDEIINGGELLIFTNSVSAPGTLAVYFDRNSGWETEEIDLTPYLGNVVFLVWHHQLFSLSLDGAVERPGWAIDDISVTVSNIPPGAIHIANNLVQARVSVAGPVTRAGQGYSVNLTNLPPGRYVTTWSTVPHYQTPPSQTNMLSTDGVIELAGNYTFPDTNNNGISDTWETQFFGGLSPVRSCLTDFDGDGFSDCAEFIAGTNPTNAASYLRLSVPTTVTSGGFQKMRFQWTSVPGRIYQVQGYNFDLQTWIPRHSTWVQATASSSSIIISVPEENEPYIFRVEVRP